MQASDENKVGSRIEYCREVQRDEGSFVSTVPDHADVVCSGDEGCFHAVVGSETRLSDVEELVVAEMVGEVSVDEFL